MTRKKIALIIGGSGGIGSAIVQRLLHDGFAVCATYVHEDNHRDEKSVSWHQMDLLDESATEKTMRTIIKNNPRIDVVVFAPSLPLSHTTLLETDWEAFEQQHHIQVRGMQQVVKGLELQIKEKYGIKFIVLLTEGCIGKPPARLAPYVTAKYGLLGLAKAMAVEFSSYQCTTNCVSPGMVETELIASFPAKMVEMAAIQNPLRRIAKPDDVACTVAFLASDASDYVNGVNIAVNGGSVML